MAMMRASRDSPRYFLGRVPLGTDAVPGGRVPLGTDGAGGNGAPGRVPLGTDAPPGRVPLGTDGPDAGGDAID